MGLVDFIRLKGVFMIKIGYPTSVKKWGREKGGDNLLLLRRLKGQQLELKSR